LAVEFEHFVSAEVIAEFLGVARATVLALARRGELPAYPLPTGGKGVRRTYRFKLSEILARMDESE
jgi:excisionase family DNA binding protein